MRFARVMKICVFSKLDSQNKNTIFFNRKNTKFFYFSGPILAKKKICVFSIKKIVFLF